MKSGSGCNKKTLLFEFLMIFGGAELLTFRLLFYFILFFSRKESAFKVFASVLNSCTTTKTILFALIDIFSLTSKHNLICHNLSQTAARSIEFVKNKFCSY